MARPLLASMVMTCTLTLAGNTALAGPIYDFYRITHSSAPDVGSQLSVQVLGGPAANQVDFVFRNDGSPGAVASSICDIYFDDNAGVLQSLTQVLNGTGVAFSGGAAPPNLPGGNAISFSADFTADSDAGRGGVMLHGINPGEMLTLRFTLRNSITYTMVENAFTLGAQNPLVAMGLRIGIHVQGLPNGQSDSFVAWGDPPPPVAVPLPSGVALAAVGLGVVVRRRVRPLR